MNDKLLSTLELVYGNQAERILKSLTIPWNRLAQTPPFHSDCWYKFIELYCIYPDGIIYHQQKTPLQNLKLHLKKVKSLGCNAIHILPFLDSPMLDQGFDISDFYTVRPSLGTFSQLLEIIQEAQNLGLQLFMDIVFNHVSDQHVWFQKAQQGNPHYRNYFIHTEQKPELLRKYYQDSAIWADYLVNGRVISVNIAFPEQAGAIPHWRQGTDTYWYYHTYYPEQIDLNWFNPEIFIELAKVIIYWTELGFNFRFDAIPFIGKGAYKRLGEDNKISHALITALKLLVHAINPHCAFIVESYEPLDTVIGYFGEKEESRANLSYNFHLCTQLWVSLINQDSSYLWQILAQVQTIPLHAEWLNFLRNHDELSLAYLSEDLLLQLHAKLLPYGEDFREGCGVSGRTFAFLGQNPKRLLMAYFLLASLPGGIVIPYGDEIGVDNTPLKRLPLAKQKDTRNIHRGSLDAARYQSLPQQSLFKKFAYIIGHRKILRDYLNIWPQEIKAVEKTIFAACYQGKHGQLFIYINLTEKPQSIHVNQKLKQLVFINEITRTKNKLTLGAYAGIWLST